MSLGALELRLWRADAVRLAGPGWRLGTCIRRPTASRARLNHCSFSTDSYHSDGQAVVSAATPRVPHHQLLQGGQPAAQHTAPWSSSIIQQLAAAAVWVSIIPAAVLAVGAASGPPAAWQGALSDAFSFTVLTGVFLTAEPAAAIACAVSATGAYASLVQGWVAGLVPAAAAALATVLATAGCTVYLLRLWRLVCQWRLPTAAATVWPTAANGGSSSPQEGASMGRQEASSRSAGWWFDRRADPVSAGGTLASTITITTSSRSDGAQAHRPSLGLSSIGPQPPTLGVWQHPLWVSAARTGGTSSSRWPVAAHVSHTPSRPLCSAPTVLLGLARSGFGNRVYLWTGAQRSHLAVAAAGSWRCPWYCSGLWGSSGFAAGPADSSRTRYLSHPAPWGTRRSCSSIGCQTQQERGTRQHKHPTSWARRAPQAGRPISNSRSSSSSSSDHLQQQRQDTGGDARTGTAKPATCVQLREPQPELLSDHPITPATLATADPVEAACEQQTLEGGWHVFQAGVGCTLLAVLVLPATTSGVPIGLLAAGGLLTLVTCLWVRAARQQRQQQLTEQLWEDLPAWTATLLLIWQPLAELLRFILHPATASTAGPITAVLWGLAANGLMVPRAYFQRELMWFTGTCTPMLLALLSLALA